MEHEVEAGGLFQASDLPADILLLICQELLAWDENGLAEVCRVCKAWHAVAQPIHFSDRCEAVLWDNVDHFKILHCLRALRIRPDLGRHI